MECELPLAQRLKLLRHCGRRKLTQQQLGRALDLSRKTICAIERRRVSRPQYCTIEKVKQLEARYAAEREFERQMRDFKGW